MKTGSGVLRDCKVVSETQFTPQRGEDLALVVASSWNYLPGIQEYLGVVISLGIKLRHTRFQQYCRREPLEWSGQQRLVLVC
jgi:hypothetical protein